MDTFVIMNSSCTASGTINNLKQLDQSDSDCIITKTCTLNPRSRTTKPYYHYDGFGATNNIGLCNQGFEYYKSERFSKPYIISLTGPFNEVNEMLKDRRSTADMYELNISCPNIDKSEQYISIEYLSFLRHTKPFGIKLPPYQSNDDIERWSSFISNLKFQPRYIVCSNTLYSKQGGLSGGYLKPIALKNVELFRRLLPLSIKVYGCGGVKTIKDVEDYRNAGADGVQIGTELIERGPKIFRELKSGIQASL